jgi:hypothetical protein
MTYTDIIDLSASQYTIRMYVQHFEAHLLPLQYIDMSVYQT